LEFFGSVDKIALAKRELIEGLAGRGSVAVLNADDMRVARFAEVAPGRILTFGISPRADFHAENVEDWGVEGSAFDFVAPAGRARLSLRLPGRHNISNALAALSAASVWGIGADEASEVFPDLEPTGMRGRLLHYDAGFSVINDCYNSNPVALVAMVELLARTHTPGRRILVAGEMLELGRASRELHREAGHTAATIGSLDWIIGVQGEAASFVRGAIEGGHPAKQTNFFPSSAEAAEFIAGFVRSKDLLLVKGSRGVKMERIVEALDARYPRQNHEPAGAAPEPLNRLG
jgi:UDP-N-acetylmuramoyl-tripeptide--D-alanyl-D-alanine ligase